MKRLLSGLVNLLVVLGVVLAALAIWRAPAVETGLRLWLASQGIEASFDVSEVEPRRAVIENARLAPGGPAARRLVLTYSPADLLAGHVRSLRIEGLRADIAPGAGQGGGLPDWLTSDDAPVDRVEIADARIALSAPLPGELALDGSLVLAGPARTADLRLRWTGEGSTAELSLTSGGLAPGGQIALEGQARLAPAEMPATGGQLKAGTATLTLQGALSLPETPRDLLPAALALEGHLALSDIATVAGDRLAADLPWRLIREGERLRLTLPSQATGSLSGPILARLEPLGLPPSETATLTVAPSDAPLLTWQPGPEGGTIDLRSQLALALGDTHAEAAATATIALGPGWRPAGPLHATASGSAETPAFTAGTTRLHATAARFDLSATRDATGALTVSGPLTLTADTLDAPPVTATGARLDGRIDLATGGAGWHLSIAPGATLAADALAWPERLRTDAPVQAQIIEAEAGPDALSLTLDTRDIAGAALDGDTPLWTFTDAHGRLILDRPGDAPATLRLADIALTLPDQQLALDAVSLSLPLSDGPAEAALTVTDTATPARIVPLTLAAQGSRTGDDLALSGTLATRSGKASLPLELRADLATAQGDLVAGPGTLLFGPGLRPADLGPALAPLAPVKGALEVRIAAKRGPEGITTPATLTFNGLSAAWEDLEVSGLTGTVSLANVFPLVTDGAQTLEAATLVAAVPLEAPSLRFRLAPGPVMTIERASGRVAGGTVSTRDVTAGPGKDLRLAVDVAGVEIGRLLQEWKIQGITGTGRLSGRIPVRVSAAGITVSDGHLAAEGPGAIRVDWGGARDRLVASGRQVELAVKALEDFRYQSLDIGIDQPAGGALTLAIGLDGANPALLDGYPFRFNVNLSGQLAPILEAVRAGRRVGGDLIRSGLGAR